ncbi:MAG: TetR/AcrR family transcriptional regulator [Rhizomicrobium sp.]
MSDPRWRRRKEARPQEILDAALGCFARKGFAATRMDDIAEQAGVTKGTIYLYFENKDAVFKALVRESIGTRVGEVLEEVHAFEGSSRDLLRAALTTIGEFLRTSDRVVLPKVILAEAGNFPELARFYREEIIDKGLGALSAIVERGIRRGEFRMVDPQHTARLCIAPLLLSAVWRTTFAQFDAKPYDYSSFLETHLDVLLRGLAAEGDSR